MCLLLAVTFSTIMSWFAFPWWGALVVTLSNVVALWLFIGVAATLESMIRESDQLLIEMRRTCDDLNDRMERTGLVN